jgi:hypothetical protein
MITDDEMHLIAQWHHAVRMDAEVPGMKGFAAHYYRSLKGADKDLVDHFERQRIQIAGEQLELHEKHDSKP